MPIEAAARTDVGRVRKENQDAFAVAPAGASPWWAVVCDGMGGHAEGGVAARMAVETFEEGLEDLAAGVDHAGRLDGLAHAANDRILRYAAADPSRFMMGTTFVGLVLDLAPPAPKAVVANAGDSPAFRLRDGRLERMTEDHTVARDLVRRGLVPEEMAGRVEQGDSLSRVLGMDDFPGIEGRGTDVRPGDVWLLASDGLTKVVPPAEIARALGLPPVEAAERLVALTLERGAPDNVTVVVARAA